AGTDSQLKVEVQLGAGVRHRLWRARLADEGDELALSHLRPDGNPGRNAVEVAVARHDAVAVVDPDLAAAELVERLFRVRIRLVRRYLRRGDVYVVQVGADDPPALGGDDVRAARNRRAVVHLVEVNALVDAVAVGPGRVGH